MVKLHLAVDRTVAQPGEGVDDDPQPFDPLQPGIPRDWHVAVHLGEDVAVMRTLQDGLGFGRQLHGVIQRPAGQHAGMHHQQIAFAPGQFPVAQPMQQFFTVGGRQHFDEGVSLAQAAIAFGQGQQVQVVIAEHADGGITQRFEKAQQRQRVGATIDQIPYQP